jgi:type IV pilus assembly protein PilQ
VAAEAAGRGGSSASGGGGGAEGEGLLPIIKRRLSRRGSIEVDGRSNSLIITDVRQNIDAIRQLVAILDQAEPQVEIESRIVVATRNFSRDIGVQIAGLVIGKNGAAAGGGTLGGNVPPVGMTVPGTLPAGGPDGQPHLEHPEHGSRLDDRSLRNSHDQHADHSRREEGTGEDHRYAARHDAQQSQGEDRKQDADPDLDDPGGEAGGDPIVTTTYVDVPLKLEITPQITDVGTVVLDVLAENASAAASAGGVTPTINTQIMETQVTVPDGGTTVVGGVLFDDERESTDRTPGLSRLPLIGNLFKRKGVERNTNEILFFITPRISRPDWGNVAGSSGTRPSASIMQPVPLGNPPSNSDTMPVEVNRANPSSAAPVTYAGVERSAETIAPRLHEDITSGTGKPVRSRTCF